MRRLHPTDNNDDEFRIVEKYGALAIIAAYPHSFEPIMIEDWCKSLKLPRHEQAS